MWLIIISGAVAVAAACGYFASVFMPGKQSSAFEDRLQTLVVENRKRTTLRDQKESLLIAGGLADTKHWLERLLGSFPKLTAYLQQADMKITAARFVAICGAAFLGGSIAVVISPAPSVFAPFGGLLCASIPIVRVSFKRKRRLAAFGRQLPDALELLSRSLRSGHSLGSGLNLVATEMADPISAEFTQVFEEQNLGIPLEEALSDLAERIPNLDLRFFATAVILQRTTGGDLAEIFDKIGRLIRERQQIYGQVQALTGEGRLSGVVLLALPPVLFLVMLYLNPTYIMMLFTEPMGRKMLAFAIVTQLIGAIAIKKIITIKV